MLRAGLVRKAIACARVGVLAARAEALACHVACKDIGNRGQAVRGLVNVRGVAQVRGLVLEVTRHGVGMSTWKGLVQRGRLDDSLIGKLFVGRGYNGETWWGPFLGRGRGRLEAGAKGIDFGSLGSGLCAGTSSLVEACIDDLALLIAHRDAALNVLTHVGILGFEARGKTCYSNIVHAQTTGLASREGSRGTRRH